MFQLKDLIAVNRAMLSPRPVRAGCCARVPSTIPYLLWRINALAFELRRRGLVRPIVTAGVEREAVRIDVGRPIMGMASATSRPGPLGALEVARLTPLQTLGARRGRAASGGDCARTRPNRARSTTRRRSGRRDPDGCPCVAGTTRTPVRPWHVPAGR